MNTLKNIAIGLEGFLALPEYSATMPTGVTPGKQWRRHDGAHDPDCKDPKWFLLEYVDAGDGIMCFIQWYVVTFLVNDSKFDDLEAAKMARRLLGAA